MSDAGEIAKAVQSVANFGTEGVKACRDLGMFLADTFKEPTSMVVGMVTCRLRYVDFCQALKLANRVMQILRERGVSDPRPVLAKLGLPILEQSCLEEDDDLHRLWCNLLANAMDPNFDGEIRVCFVDMLKAITSTDAKILDFMYKDAKRYDRLNDLSQLSGHAFAGRMLASSLSIGPEAYLVSAYNLMRLQCVAATVLEPMESSPPETRMRWDMGPDEVVLTPLGMKFIEACMDLPGGSTLTLPSQ